MTYIVQLFLRHPTNTVNINLFSFRLQSRALTNQQIIVTLEFHLQFFAAIVTLKQA